jgi:hypothetical protein
MQIMMDVGCVIGLVSHMGPSFIPNTSKTVQNWPGLDLFHESNRLYLLKPIRVSLYTSIQDM